MVYQNYNEIATNNYVINYYVGNIPNDTSSAGQTNLPQNYYIYKKPKNTKFLYIMGSSGGQGGGGGSAGTAGYCPGGGGGHPGGLGHTIIPGYLVPDILYVRPGNGGKGGSGGNNSVSLSANGYAGQSGTQSLVTCFDGDLNSVDFGTYAPAALFCIGFLSGAAGTLVNGGIVGNTSTGGGYPFNYVGNGITLNGNNTIYFYAFTTMSLGISKYIADAGVQGGYSYAIAAAPALGAAGVFNPPGGGGGGVHLNGTAYGCTAQTMANSNYVFSGSFSYIDYSTSTPIGGNGLNSYNYGKDILSLLKTAGSSNFIGHLGPAMGGGGKLNGNGGNGGHGAIGCGGGGGGGAQGTNVIGGTGGDGGPGFIYIKAIL